LAYTLLYLVLMKQSLEKVMSCTRPMQRRETVAPKALKLKHHLAFEARKGMGNKTDVENVLA